MTKGNPESAATAATASATVTSSKPALVANPAAEIRLVVHAPLRNDPKRTIVRVEKDPELLVAIAKILGQPHVDWAQLGISVDMRLKLIAMGLVVKPAEVIELPVFRCGGADLESELLPGEVVDAADNDELAPDALFARNECPPGVSLPPKSAERLDLVGETVWVPDARAGLRLPCSLPDGTIARIRAGQPLPTSTWRLLRNAGATRQSPRRSRSLSIDALRAELDEMGTVVLRDLLPPLTLSALRTYVRALYAGGSLLHNPHDEQFPERWYVHNEPVARILHEPLARLVNELSPSPVKPSYCFFARYGAGARMPVHTDREQCRWNMSFVVDADPVPTEEDAWPLNITERGQTRAARLCIGDAVLYSGTISPHGRDTLHAGNYSVVFFHFVDENFTGSLD